MTLLLPGLAIIAGFVALVWGADRFVSGAAAVARNFGVPPLVIGLTVVGFGTSAPEMLVSTVAALADSGGLAIGNALGSNITNIGLVLGVTALIAPLEVHSKILRRELPFLMLTMVVVLALMWDRDLSRVDGAILLAGLMLLVGGMVWEGLRSRGNGVDPLETEFADELPPVMDTKPALFWVVVGLATLLGSARLVVWGAEAVARHFGVPELIIGLTVVAVGTSLPELAASVVSAVKKEHDIAIGNVIGSNMFNLLGVLAWPALLAPGPFEAAAIERDIPVMFAITVLLMIMARGLRIRSRIARLEGGVLLAAYVGYLVLLFFELR